MAPGPLGFSALVVAAVTGFLGGWPWWSPGLRGWPPVESEGSQPGPTGHSRRSKRREARRSSSVARDLDEEPARSAPLPPAKEPEPEAETAVKTAALPLLAALVACGVAVSGLGLCGRRSTAGPHGLPLPDLAPGFSDRGKVHLASSGEVSAPAAAAPACRKGGPRPVRPSADRHAELLQFLADAEVTR